MASSAFAHNSDPVGGFAELDWFARRTWRNVLRVPGEAMSSRCSSMVPFVESSAMVGIIIGILVVFLSMCIYKVQFLRYFVLLLLFMLLK